MKLTDEQIVNGLEEYLQKCQNIKYGARKSVLISSDLLKDILDLINRRNKRIAELQLSILSCNSDIADVEKLHGDWIVHQNGEYWHYDCPFCDDGFATKGKDLTPPNYCSNCGSKMGKSNEVVPKLQEALENIVWYHCHYEWLEPLADELEKATTNYLIPPAVLGVGTERHFIWMLLVGMFGNWGTSIGGGWIEKTKECAAYIRTLCAKAKGEVDEL